jgi:raffinose/stachyose/melibiose transport system substrate-binding protein
VEGYGIIYNNAIMQKYFALTAQLRLHGRINSFAALKAVVKICRPRRIVGIVGCRFQSLCSQAYSGAGRPTLQTCAVLRISKTTPPTTFTVLAGLAAATIAFKYGDKYRNIFTCTSKLRFRHGV